VKGGGRAPPPPPAGADFSIHDGMYARNRQLPLCVYSVIKTTKFEQIDSSFSPPRGKYRNYLPSGGRGLKIQERGIQERSIPGLLGMIQERS
jgi:hypothetical protein